MTDGIPDEEQGAWAGRERLTAYGFDDERIDALYRLWNPQTDDRYDLIEPFLSYDAAILRQYGWDPATTYDVIEHGLTRIPDKRDPDRLYGVLLAHEYLTLGFTPHQAHLIEHTPIAAANLYRDGQRGFDAFLNLTDPQSLQVNVLLVAETRAEADAYVERYRTATDDEAGAEDPAAVQNEVAMLAALRADKNALTFLCDCGQGHA